MFDTSSPYRIPAPPLAPPENRARLHLRASFILLGAAAAIFAISLVVSAATEDWIFGFLGLAFAAFIALIGSVRGSIAAALGAKSPEGERGRMIASSVAATLLNLGLFVIGGIAAFASTMTFSRGRQLRRFGRVLLPKVVDGDAWTLLPVVVSVPSDVRSGLAMQWRENGRTEHASVGAFARLTLDLLALGAPPDLVAAAQRDALDEIRHAELCFSIARGIDDKRESPGAFPEGARARTLAGGRALALAQLAVDSLVDGALHEGVSARIIAKLAARCEEPTIRAALKEIAADEGRHAAHGWDVVLWCAREGGDAVVSALRGAVCALPSAMRSPLPDRAAGGEWERWGIHGHALEQDEFARARGDVLRRVQKLEPVRQAAPTRLRAP